jgi:hypothetical protein
MDDRHLLMLDGNCAHPEDIARAIRFSEEGGALLPHGLLTFFHGGLCDFYHDGANVVLQPIAAGLNATDTLHLACILLTEVRLQAAELRSWALDGGIPTYVKSFEELYAHCDPNMLGNGGNAAAFLQHAVVGKSVADLSEAWCGVFNCAHAAVDAELKAGLLDDLTLSPGRSGP